MEKCREPNKKIKSVTLKIIQETTATQYYLDVKNGKRDVQYIHKDLEPILKYTNGVFVYQESVMKCLVDICNMTWEETDIIRSAIAKKKHSVIMATFDRIREATLKRGWTLEQANQLCQSIQAFSRYSFNRSHSFCYAELGYITMYLKHHHKLEWWCATLNNEDDEDKMRHYVSILGDMLTLPTILEPNDKFIIKGNKIVAPVSIVKGVGPKAYIELASHGKFTDLKDFCSKINNTKVDIGTVSQLIKARVMDDFMDKNLPCDQARIKFMNEYCSYRASKPKFKLDVVSNDPLKLYLMEREANTAFNKSILADKDLLTAIANKWPGLKTTGKLGIPFIMGDTPVLRNINIAVGLLDKKFDKDVALICLFTGSEVLKGVSKKSGKDYCFTKMTFSDGFIDFEGVDFNRKVPLKLPINSIVYIKGTLKEGWKVPISININEIEQIQL